MKPLAIIPAYHEDDILPWTLAHLQEQDCEPFLIEDTNERTYDWYTILCQIEAVAQRWPGRWIMLHDADELRYAGPHYRGKTIAEALSQIEWFRFNAVNFHVRNFVPIDNGWDGSQGPTQYFRFHTSDFIDARTRHVKAWIQPEGRVDLHTHGGHEVLFPGRYVYPLSLRIDHYPIRSQSHGERKVFQERKPRFRADERARNWHAQYDRCQPGCSFLGRPADLIPKRDTTIVTLSRFPDIFERFAASVERFEPHRRRIVVTSGGLEILRFGWESITGAEPFIFGRNANLGIRAAGDDDVLLVNDDVEFVEPIIDELQSAGQAEDIGLISPQIIGDGINNSWARASRKIDGRIMMSNQYVPLVCALLKREGKPRLPEHFEGYGGDDEDFHNRMAAFGLRAAVSGRVKVKHGFGEHRYSSSFLRVMSEEERSASMAQMRGKLG